MKLKILYSAPIDPVSMAAPGYHVACVANELNSLGDDVFVIHKGDLRDDIPAEKQRGLNLKANILTSDLKYALALRKQIKANNYDLIYHRFNKWSVFPLLMMKWLRIPRVIEINADVRTDLQSEKKSRFVQALYGLVEKIQTKLASRIVVVSHGVSHNLVAHHPAIKSKIQVIENGTDDSVFHPQDRDSACKELGLDPTRTYLAFTGSLQPWQGLETLVASASDVVAKHPSVAFLIVGDGVCKDEMVEQIRSNVLEEHFEFAGWCSSDKVAKYIAASDICLAPYSKAAALPPKDPSIETKHWFMKGSPLKLYTYMAMGKPVVATDFADCGQRIEEWKTGLAFVPGDAAGMAAAIDRLLSNPKLAKEMGENGHARVAMHHTWQGVAKQIHQMCEQLI